MSNTEKQMTTSTGISLGVILSIIFMVLKLCGVITWSWWYVLAPILIEIGIVIIITIIICLIYFCKR